MDRILRAVGKLQPGEELPLHAPEDAVGLKTAINRAMREQWPIEERNAAGYVLACILDPETEGSVIVRKTAGTAKRRGRKPAKTVKAAAAK